MARVNADGVSNNDVNREVGLENVTHHGKVWLIAYQHRPT